MAKLIRLRDRNQITLPGELAEKLSLKEDDYLAAEVTPEGRIQLWPTRLARVGSPEAEAQRREAEEDIRAGRFETYSSTRKAIEAVVRRVHARRRVKSGGAGGESVQDLLRRVLEAAAVDRDSKASVRSNGKVRLRRRSRSSKIAKPRR